MANVEVPEGWVHQAYRFCVEPTRLQARQKSSHTGAKRYAFNWGLRLVEDRLTTRETYRVLALRQGARMEEAEEWAKTMAPVPWSQAALRLVWNEEKDVACAKDEVTRRRAQDDLQSRRTLEVLALRQGATLREARRWAETVVPKCGWWKECSKECYSSAFSDLEQAFQNYFASREANRSGKRVGWPKPKRRTGHESVSFSTGAIRVIDRHHVQLPVMGAFRTLEPTDQLREKLAAGEARVLGATLGGDGVRTYVSFGVVAKKERPQLQTPAVSGTDVGIRLLATHSDGSTVENPRAEAQVRKKLNRYQRKMDRQHRAGSPRCFGSDGTHVAGTCHWTQRSKRSEENKKRIAKAHRRAADIRGDALHKESHRMATTNAVNVMEDLFVSGMTARGHGKRGSNRAARDAALAELRRQMAYKHSWYGTGLWLADRFFPSSKMCSGCRKVEHDLRRDETVFHCGHCGLVIDRDLNAAKNLAGLAELACLFLMMQMSTGEPVDWSKLPVRPYGWENDRHDTRSSRGSARAGGHMAKGAEVRPAAGRAARRPVGVLTVDREAVGAAPRGVAA